MQLSYLALFITVLFAKLTHQQKMELVRISDKADKEIRFLQYDEIDKAISQGVWLLYFGAHWCTNTAKFNPKFLEVQKRVVDEKLRVNVAKIECSVDHEGI